MTAARTTYVLHGHWNCSPRTSRRPPRRRPTPLLLSSNPSRSTTHALEQGAHPALLPLPFGMGRVAVSPRTGALLPQEPCGALVLRPRQSRNIDSTSCRLLALISFDILSADHTGCAVWPEFPAGRLRHLRRCRDVPGPRPPRAPPIPRASVVGAPVAATSRSPSRPPPPAWAPSRTGVPSAHRVYWMPGVSPLFGVKAMGDTTGLQDYWDKGSPGMTYLNREGRIWRSLAGVYARACAGVGRSGGGGRRSAVAGDRETGARRQTRAVMARLAEVLPTCRSASYSATRTRS